MAGAVDADLAIAVAQAGGLGSLPVALLNEQQLRAQMEKIRAATRKPVNLNFFCHTPPVPSNAREHAWREALKPYYAELGSIRRRRCRRATARRSMRHSARPSRKSSRRW